MENCDCINESEDKIIQFISERKTNPKGFKIIASSWEHTSNYPIPRLYINYIVKSIFEKKDGTLSKQKTENIIIYFSYCPFCGKKYHK
jgi:hypothetical protein